LIAVGIILTASFKKRKFATALAGEE